MLLEDLHQKDVEIREGDTVVYTPEQKRCIISSIKDDKFVLQYGIAKIVAHRGQLQKL